MKNSSNHGFEYSMEDLSHVGTDVAGDGKVHSKKASKYKSRWSAVKHSASNAYNRGKCDTATSVLWNVHDAVREGTLELVEQAISKAKKNKSLNILDDTGLASLHHAVRYNRVEAVESLLKHGVQVNIQTREEMNTPLHISSRYGWLESTKLLLQHGANPNITNIGGSSPLHLACRRGNKSVVAVLLGAVRLDINIPDNSLMVPLHIAAIQGDAELCNMLMDKGADYQALAADKMTPLLAAVANGNRATAKAILERVLAVSAGDISSITRARDIDSNTILHLAALTNNLEIADKIIVKCKQNVNLTTNSFLTPLHVAADKGHLDMVKLLVANGAHIQAKSFDGRTSLHKAAVFGYKDIINFLLDKGAVVDERDYANKTPFLVAVESGQTESALLLLSRGANIHAYDAMVKNCLHLATENENLDTLIALLDIKDCIENLYSLDIQERVPLHYAAICSNIKILETILTKQTRFVFQDENQETPVYLAAKAGRAAHLEALGRAGSPVNDRDDEGKSPLHIAATKGHKKVCLTLLKLGADINNRDNSRSTPFILAAKSGALKTCLVLLENGAQIDDVNTTGDTALLEATRYNHVSIVEMLLDYGASILIRNNENMGIIDVAVRWGSSDVVMAICKQPRYQEVLNDNSGAFGHSPMKLLIAHFPNAAKLVMDKCINSVEQTSQSHPDYAVNYDFTFLDPGPDDPGSLKGNRYFGPETMVEYNREELLLHPLTQILLKYKWNSSGRILYYFSFTLYLAFLIAYTAFLILERNVAKIEKVNETSTFYKMYELRDDSKVFPMCIMIFAVAQMLKELFQIFLQGRVYFTQSSNIVEWTIYGTAVIFLIPYVAPREWVNEYYGKINNPYDMWIIAVVSIFLCYVNFILFLRRFATLGIYITMHMQVVKTLLNVMVVFVIFILSFAVVFFILFKEQDAFNDLGRSFLKVTIMMIGEIEYVTTFIDSINATSTSTGQKQNPFPETAFVFIFIFVFIMGIALMNLLVGLAVGDIDKVQREATLKRLAMQVEFVAQIDDKYPRMLTRLIYKRSVIIWPNRVTFFSRCRGFFVRRNKAEVNIVKEVKQETEYQHLTSQLTKTRKRVKTIVLSLEAQNRLLKTLVNKIDPSLLERHLADEQWILPEEVEDDFKSSKKIEEIVIPEHTEEENQEQAQKNGALNITL